MKSICFHCHFIGVGIKATRCPVCSFPLIVNTPSAALGSQDLERMFERASQAKAPPLPGVSPEPRSAQLLAERRRQRARSLAEARKKAARRAARRKAATSFFAASALVAGLIVALNALI